MSNTDLQQFNGTASFPATADVGTNADPFLIPTDGPLITADSNLINQAPANPAWQRCKNLLLGLRGAVFGDFVGAVRKTLRSLEVDGTPGGSVTSTLADGEIQALSHIRSLGGDLLALAGAGDVGSFLRARIGSVISGDNTVALAPYAEQTPAFLEYQNTGTGAGDANPPQGTVIANQLRAINIPKVSVNIETDGAGNIDFAFGHGVLVAAIVGGNTIEITFNVSFVNSRYTLKTGNVFLGGASILVGEDASMRTNSKCVIQAVNTATSTLIDFSTTAIQLSIDVDGEQST